MFENIDSEKSVNDILSYADSKVFGILFSKTNEENQDKIKLILDTITRFPTDNTT